HPLGVSGWRGTGLEGLPFAWTGVRLYAAGATHLRARLRRAPLSGVSLLAADQTGAPVVSVDSLVLRPMSAQQLAALHDDGAEALFRLDWVPVPVPPPTKDVPFAAERWAVVGDCGTGLAAGLRTAGLPVVEYPDLPATAERDMDGSGPSAVVLCRAAVACTGA